MGSHISNEHCVFENDDGIVKMVPCPDALCYVNGSKVCEPIVLKSGSRVILGKNHVFRYQNYLSLAISKLFESDSFKIISI